MARSRAARVASSTIAEVLATFLADERRRLAPRTLAQYEEFLRYFMVRKVTAGRDLLRIAGTMTKRLALWLAEKRYATASEAEDAAERGTRAARNLPKADQLASLLHDFAESQYRGDDRNGILDHFTVTRVERGKVWLQGTDGREFGHVAVPQEISSRCNLGWMISGMLGGRGRRWRLVEAGNVYPN